MDSISQNVATVVESRKMRTDDMQRGPASRMLNIAVVDCLVVGVASDLDQARAACNPAE